MQLGVSAHMQFVNDGVIPRHAVTAGLSPPIKFWIDDDALRHERCTVALIESQIVARLHLVAEYGRVPFQLANVRAGVGVEQQFVGIETVALFRLVGSVNPISINGARPDVRKVAMPDLVGVFRQFDPIQFPLPFIVEQTDLDLRGMG